MSSLGTNPQSGSGHIVVGVDGSSHSEEALRWAISQARFTGQPVDAVISWTIPSTVPVDPEIGGAAVIDWEGIASNTLRDTVANAAHTSDTEKVTQQVVMGHPAQVLLDAATDAALLVVGSRGRGGFKGVLLGSVSQHVVANAACPVVVVRARETPAE